MMMQQQLRNKITDLVKSEGAAVILNNSDPTIFHDQNEPVINQATRNL